jgi:Subtilase family/Carboxypeptidase regulatory-like domain
MSNDKRSSNLGVIIQDAGGKLVSNATVTLQLGRETKRKVPFDKRTGQYRIADVAAGPAKLSVSCTGMDAQERDITLQQGETQALFILAKKGVKTFFREHVRVPVSADPGLVAVSFNPKFASRATDAADSLFSGLSLAREKAPPLAEEMGMFLLRASNADAGADAIARALEQLDRNEMIEHAGAVVSLREQGFSFLSRQVVVRFIGTKTAEVQSIAKELGFGLERELVYAPNTYVLHWSRPATLDILDAIEKLAARKDVDWAEPNLIVSPELDSIFPTDRLWNGLWDRQLINCPDAWQALQDAGLETFGDPDLILAVWDTGVQTSGGVPTNDDFAGTVSNGSNKVFATFNFNAMVPNNDSVGDHGSGVAGVSVARANNPAPGGTDTYGLCGSAPNVRMMCIAGNGSNDISIGDQYIWMAGFDPQSTTAGFPAQLSRGADVITCSLGIGAGAPLSGTARATLDFVTTFGRGGKGTMCFFSTGNNNQNNITARPYGAYEKCFGIAAISYANDGVTEVRGPYSGWGQIAFCSPSQDQYPAFHNPPTGFAPWAAAHLGQGNLPSFVQTQTTTTAASLVGATTLTVVSTTGFAVNAVIHVGPFGAVGSEPARVTAVNAALQQITVQGYLNGAWTGGLINAHASGVDVVTGPPNHKNNFGGTSSATPICAGVAALVLSANPDLTYIEAREVMRNTAIKLDLTSIDPTGQWLDANGNPSVGSGLPAVRSQWYGYGRIDAAAAVNEALTFADTRDLVIRDNLADTGAVASAGAFWNSPDIWCRRDPPASDPGALPANYAAAGPHLDPKRGQANYIYARVRNNGTAASLDAWVRLSVTHWPGTEFTWPASFQPTHGPGDPLPSPMTPGTYFIGEVKVTGLAPGADQIVSIEWPAAMIPPATVTVSGSPVNWHPCLLAEITPHDGPAPTGNHIWDDNNLAQKNISIVDVDSGSDFAAAIVIGHEENAADHLFVEIYRGNLDRRVQLYVDLLDPLRRRRMRKFGNLTRGHEANTGGIRPMLEHGDTLLLERVVESRSVRSLQHWSFGQHGGREVLLLKPFSRVRIPIPVDKNRPAAITIGGIMPKNSKPGKYPIIVVQRQPNGDMGGSAMIELNVKK